MSIPPDKMRNPEEDALMRLLLGTPSTGRRVGNDVLAPGQSAQGLGVQAESPTQVVTPGDFVPAPSEDTMDRPYQNDGASIWDYVGEGRMGPGWYRFDESDVGPDAMFGHNPADVGFDVSPPGTDALENALIEQDMREGVGAPDPAAVFSEDAAPVSLGPVAEPEEDEDPRDPRRPRTPRTPRGY